MRFVLRQHPRSFKLHIYRLFLSSVSFCFFLFFLIAFCFLSTINIISFWDRAENIVSTHSISLIRNIVAESRQAITSIPRSFFFFFFFFWVWVWLAIAWSSFTWPLHSRLFNSKTTQLWRETRVALQNGVFWRRRKLFPQYWQVPICPVKKKTKDKKQKTKNKKGENHTQDQIAIEMAGHKSQH